MNGPIFFSNGSFLKMLSNKNTPPKRLKFKTFDYSSINWTLNFTLESIGSAIVIKIF